jgi:hypothetical protein
MPRFINDSVQQLLRIARTGELFHDPTGVSFADVNVNGHRETFPIRSKRYSNCLAYAYFKQSNEAAPSQALKSTVELVEELARHDGPERRVFVRVAENGGRIFLDLGDSSFRAIEIAPLGWAIVDTPPVRFLRPDGLLPLPVPIAGGSIKALAQYVNLETSDDFVIVVSWLLAALCPRGPYPILCVSGEHGSAKTFSFRVLKDLVDPNVSPIRTLPRNERDLFIAASNCHAMAYDNLPCLPPWLSDAFCRLATGAGFATRRLRTDQSEVLFEAARPLMLNGIEDFVSQPDLADRSLFLRLAPIPDASRRSEEELRAKFEEEKPQMLGALLAGLAHGLRAGPAVSHEALPRMADFAKRATACETAFWPAGTFTAAYAKNRQQAVDLQIDADSVATDVIVFMRQRQRWTGTASELLQQFAQSNAEQLRNGKTRHSTPQALAGRLRRSAPNLRKAGHEITFDRIGHVGRRTITINKMP